MAYKAFVLSCMVWGIGFISCALVALCVPLCGCITGWIEIVTGVFDNGVTC